MNSSGNNQHTLLPRLFRTEFRKITTVLCRRFGIAHIELAEDIAGETFLLALETWPYKGVPENPVAWLYAVAKNKALNHLTRQGVFHDKVVNEVLRNTPHSQEHAIDLSEENITDSQLQMLFALCHPSIPVEAQIGLSLRILCGFGIDEIATAFLSEKETIHKRLFRAKEKLRNEKVPIEFPAEREIAARLEAVLTTLYLLFNEGYYSESNDAVLRQEFCMEAMRLTQLLLEYEPTNQPSVNALMALMCFHASRFEARISCEGDIILYPDQDESLWNRELIARGAEFLHRASRGQALSRYHLEATIAYWHTIKADTNEKWGNILKLYDQLLMTHYTPVAALNRAYAIAKVSGKAEAIAAAEQLKLNDNPFYFVLLGELFEGIDNGKARENLEKALPLTKSAKSQANIRKKIDNLPA